MLTGTGDYDTVSQLLDTTPSPAFEVNHKVETEGSDASADLITQGSPTSRTSFVIDENETNESAKIVNQLPIWNWSNNSCSLDSALTIAFRLILHNPEELLVESATENERNDCFRVLLDYVNEWSKQDQDWENWSVTNLSAARDVIREIITATDNKVIGLNSSAREIATKLMPGVLFRPKIDHNIRCGSCGKDFVYTMNPDMLSFIGTLQRNSNTQAIIDQIVGHLSQHADVL